MSEQVSIDENDIITATYDNSEGKEDKFLNVFTNITALLETSKKYYQTIIYTYLFSYSSSNS